MAKVIQLGGAQPVDEGEALVVEHLEHQLPSNYLLYPNVELSEPNRQPFEYDLIVVAPHAVYVVEVKRWLQKISGGDFTWYLASGMAKPNPLRLANQKARVLKSRLTQFSLGLKYVWVEACVSIADEKTDLQLTGGAATRTFLYTDLPAFLQDPSCLARAGHQIYKDCILQHQNSIQQAIEQEAHVRTSVPQQIGHYRISETLERTDIADEYLAHNIYLAESLPVRLRVYAASPYMNAAQRNEHLNKIKRDAETLQSIGLHPNLVSVREFYSDDQGHFVEITDWSEAGTFRDLLERDQPLTMDQKLGVLVGIAQGLAVAHSKGIVHRDLRPDNILIESDLTPRLMNFEHARLEKPGFGTVWSPLSSDADRRYLAPELDQPSPSVRPENDLYSLGAIIYELLSNHVPFDSATQAMAAGGPPNLAELVPGIPFRLAQLASALYQVDPANRQYTAQQVADVLRQVRQGTESQGSTTTANSTTGPTYYNVGDEIKGEFKVLAVLGEGGFGQVYKVLHYITDQVYALKVINRVYELERLQKEYAILRELVHPNIARVVWAGMIRPDQFYLALEFIEGQPLSEFTKPDNLLPPDAAVRLVSQLLATLDYVHQPQRERMLELQKKRREGEELTQEEFEELLSVGRRFLHRDIKPANLMLTESGNLKLIDFNISARLDLHPSFTMAGTPAYMAPDIQMLGWDETVDVFAVGVVLYELLTGHHPYPNSLPALDSDPEDPKHYRPELADDFAMLLYKSVQPTRDERFASASEMLAELIEIGDNLLLRPNELAGRSRDISVGAGVVLPGQQPGAPVVHFELHDWEISKPNYNPYVTRLLTLYSQAKTNNAGTRGLDEISRATYVPTWLDESLRPDILAGKHRLVVITGNAGDGKTAFIQQLEADAETQHAAKVHPLVTHGARNGSRFEIAGLQFETNYDGSQDEGHKPNEEVLDDFFGLFKGEDPFSHLGADVRVIAVNEGRLLDFLHAHAGDYPYLLRAVDTFLDEAGVLPEGLLIINLNWRSVVAHGERSILSRQLSLMNRPEFWAPCQSCEYRDRCFLKANADRIADSSGGTQLIERMRTLFEIVHLRRQLHITMRDLRSALSYILLRDHSCDDVATMLNNDIPPLEYMQYFYYNAVASPDEPAIELERNDPRYNGQQLQSADRLIRLLRQVDPALVANPQDDRRLYAANERTFATSSILGFDSTTFDALLLLQVQEELQAQEVDPQGRQIRLLMTQRLRLHSMLRRKSYFERRDDNWLLMLPYRHLADFMNLTRDAEGISGGQDLKSEIAVAISKAEGMRHREYAERNVCLRASPIAKPSIKSFRLFPLLNFQLRVPTLGALGPYVEYTPDRIFFEHKSEPAVLTLSLDLFELLRDISAGTVPAPADLQGYFLNLAIFKNALSHLPYREVLLTDNDQDFYRILAGEDDVIGIEEVTMGVE